MAYKEYDDPAELRRLQVASAEILKEFDRVCAKLGIQYFVYAGTALGAVRHGGFIPWDDDIDVALLRADYERFLAEAPAEVGERFEVVDPRTTPHFPACNANLALANTVCVPEEFAGCPYRYKISIGIYALDDMVDDPLLFRRQCRSTWLWGRLAFLRATPTPYLAETGWKRVVVLAACRIAHTLMKLLGVSSQRIYGKWERAARRYEGCGSGRVADFTDRNPGDWSMSLTEIAPTKSIMFEGFLVQTACEDGVLLSRQYGDYLEIPPVEQRKNHRPCVLEFEPEQ